MFHHGASSGIANARKPENIIRQMPHTRWWMWTSPLFTPPGHQETLRVSRALVRIARNEIRNATSTRNAPPVPGRGRWPNGATLTTVASSTSPRLLLDGSPGLYVVFGGLVRAYVGS